MRPKSSPTTALVVLGGSEIIRDVLQHLPHHDLVIAADSGVELATALGLRITAVVGDMDSVHPTALAAVEALGATVVRHPRDKDASDAELALLHAAESGAQRIILLSGGGGRLDHQLGIFAVMFLDALQHCVVEARIGSSRVYAVRDAVSITAEVGATVGLIPFGGDVNGISTTGLQWPLRSETLNVAASRGISNRAITDTFSIAIQDGRLFVTVDAPQEDGEKLP
jgi:thiamine pyrophosphokinase